MNLRSKSGYLLDVWQFVAFDICVVCPSCSRQALVKTADFDTKKVDENATKVICTHCGFSKRLIEKPPAILSASPHKTMTGRYFAIGGPFDPVFQMPLWLHTTVEGHDLWAYNLEHLHFLQEHVAANLRERNLTEIKNRSIGSRLPKWMTAKKNRSLVLKKLAELAQK